MSGTARVLDRESVVMNQMCFCYICGEHTTGHPTWSASIALKLCTCGLKHPASAVKPHVLHDGKVSLNWRIFPAIFLAVFRKVPFF
ncbi:unnamed protein product [Clavelina lepadiformis]|uniref:Uncharacterized protein n=1 Tax=Clavelina lepadiformis TaxID=159417 RepID=A0ABP0FM20_CLALP